MPSGWWSGNAAGAKEDIPGERVFLQEIESRNKAEERVSISLKDCEKVNKRNAYFDFD